MNAPEMIRLHDGKARAVENLSALFFAYGVESVADLSAAIFMEFDSAPALEVMKHDGALVKTGDLCFVEGDDVESLLVCHEGRLPFRLDLTAHETPAQAVEVFGRMAEGHFDQGEVEA
jgi:hypothetical protein